RLALTSAHMSSIVAPFTAVGGVMAGNLGLLVWRTAMKMRFVGRLYGVGHALVSAPRLVGAKLIGVAAALRALREYAGHAGAGQAAALVQDRARVPELRGERGPSRGRAEEDVMSRAPVAIVIGTRPEVIKMAPIVQALHDSETLEPWVISTGQHREMLDQSLAVVGIACDDDLGVMAPQQNLSELTARTPLG